MESPILVTPSGITILVSDVQLENVKSSIIVTPAGIIMLINELQLKNT